MSMDTQIARIARERNALFLKLMQMGIVSVNWDDLDLGLMANINDWEEYCEQDGERPTECICSQETLDDEGCICGYDYWESSCTYYQSNGGLNLSSGNEDEGYYSIYCGLSDGGQPDQHDHHIESVDKFSGVIRVDVKTIGYDDGGGYTEDSIIIKMKVGDKEYALEKGKTYYFPCHNDSIQYRPYFNTYDTYVDVRVFMRLLDETKISKLSACIDHVENIAVQTNYGYSGSPDDFPGLLEFPKGYYNQNIILDYT